MERKKREEEIEMGEVEKEKREMQRRAVHKGDGKWKEKKGTSCTRQDRLKGTAQPCV